MKASTRVVSKRAARRHIRILWAIGAVAVLGGAARVLAIAHTWVVVRQCNEVFGRRYEAIRARALNAIRSQQPTEGPHVQKEVFLFDLRDRQCIEPLALTNFTPTSVEVLDQAFFSASPEGTFAIRLGGNGQGDPQASAAGHEITVMVDDADSSVAYSVPVSWLLRLSRERVPLSGTPALAETWITPCDASEATSEWVAISPAPAYEHSVFISGHWFGTYACWASGRVPARFRCTTWTGHTARDREIAGPSRT